MLTGILLMIIGFLVIALAVCAACVWALSRQIEAYRAQLDAPVAQMVREDVYA